MFKPIEIQPMVEIMHPKSVHIEIDIALVTEFVACIFRMAATLDFIDAIITKNVPQVNNKSVDSNGHDFPS